MLCSVSAIGDPRQYLDLRILTVGAVQESQVTAPEMPVEDHAQIPHEVSTACLKATSEDNLADMMDQLVADPDLRAMIIQQGFEHSARFTWERTARQTLAVYEELLQER